MYVEHSHNEKGLPEFAIKGLTLEQLNSINEMSSITHLYYGGDFQIEISEKIHECINESIKQQIIKAN